MSIIVAVRSERGDDLFLLSGTYFAHPRARDVASFPLLSGIDPVGNTIFNRGQTSRLIDEIYQVARASKDADELATHLDLMLLCQRVTSHPHRYLWFIGE